jgi:hypothetical protein
VKLITRLILTGGLTALLLACDSTPGTDQQAAAPAATIEAADVATTPAPEVPATPLPMPAAGKHVIDLSAGMVSIRANQVVELELLNELATLANFQLLSGDVDWKTVSVDMPAQPLHAALGELLQDYPYQIVYTPDKDTQREVLSEVFIGGLSAAAISDSKDTDAANKATPTDIDETSEDSEQQAYIRQLQSPQTEVRAAAVEEVEPVGDALHVLTDMLVKDPSPEVRIATSEALEDSDDPLAVAALVKCLQDEDPVVIVACTQALDFLGDETTVQHLEPLLTHYHPGVNAAAAEAIEALQ